uniref:DNA polymerase I n=1 Tax=uncultured bacterium Contig137 TaxID=1393421 RepID=W0FRB6_9BACT|nr:DNA polymerase I [uncultured bacterium Contig137]
MKLLAIDGNSIVNRAFYGIKLLSTKDGKHFTNAIQGFMNIMMKLSAEVKPDAVAVAFDVKAPTFRHEMYEGYKANRKGMPEELADQMPFLKELLTALGYRIVEAPGWEADDILGTLAGHCGESDFCYIATGDRDSLQLVGGNVNVLLASTKMGAPVTVKYDTAKIEETYLVSDPNLLIDIKALQGDASDCIPGVAGIGEKTAKELVSKFGSIDDIYASIDTIDIKSGVREKLKNGKDSAYLSRTLGTIRKDVPIDTDYSAYVPAQSDSFKVTSILSELEMYKLLERLDLKPVPKAESVKAPEVSTELYTVSDTELFLNNLRKAGKAYFVFDSGIFLFAAANGVAQILPENENYLKFTGDFLFSKEIEKYTYDCKSLYRFFYDYRNDIEINSIRADAMLCAYILNPSSSYELKRIAGEYAGCFPGEDDSPSDLVAYLPAMFDAMLAQIEENGQTRLLDEIEMPLARVLASMEKEGFLVDGEGIRKFGESLQQRIEKTAGEIYAEAGCEFNLNSPKQLGEALFEKMGLPGKKKTKSGYSTNAAVLEELAPDYPVVGKILEYRTLSKLNSTYCEGLLKVIGEDGRVHSSLNQTETRTGRISSSEPNLQNIPVRSALGREMRKFFIAKEGCVLIDADYSQIELRVLAHMANDKNMINAFNDGEDIHTITASQVFGLPPLMITPELRSRAKAVNFGIVYGIGAFSLSKNIGVSVREADEYIKGYLANFSGVDSYMKSVVENAKRTGYVETVFKRRRYLPEIQSSNGNIRASGERMAMNMPIQGTAADIIKIAMIKVSRALEEMNLRAKLILQIHDELIVEAPEDEALTVKNILKREMESAVNMRVSMLADVGSGKTWYDSKS